MRRLTLWVTVAIGLALFSILVATADWKGAIVLLARANPAYIVVYLGATFLVFFLKTVGWRVVARGRGFEIGLGTSISYALSAFAVSFVTPGPSVGGDAVGAGLVTRHKKHGTRRISYGEALSTMAIERMAELEAFALLFFLGVVILTALGDIPAGFKVTLLIVASVFLLMMVFFFISAFNGRLFVTGVIKRFSKSNRVLTEVDHFERSLVSFYRSEPREFVIVHLIAALAWLISLVEYWALLRTLGFEPSIYAVFIVYSFVGLAYTLPVPLALGTLEFAQAAAFTILGLPSVGGVLVAFITRIRDLVISAAGFLALAYHGIIPRPPQKTVRT